ncbi:hypothetical protein B4135_0352 [Caldibacillus debilis]|uniref:Uncharacterized protein n=1 Tax=Caldibacillus debilis TaxID=301148 RepID=A0A150M4I5_9BACI|nr:hypothetical protein B4135_0352 [Caldibacillus debilis]
MADRNIMADSPVNKVDIGHSPSCRIPQAGHLDEWQSPTAGPDFPDFRKKTFPKPTDGPAGRSPSPLEHSQKMAAGPGPPLKITPFTNNPFPHFFRYS